MDEVMAYCDEQYNPLTSTPKWQQLSDSVENASASSWASVTPDKVANASSAGISSLSRDDSPINAGLSASTPSTQQSVNSGINHEQERKRSRDFFQFRPRSVELASRDRKQVTGSNRTQACDPLFKHAPVHAGSRYSSTNSSPQLEPQQGAVTNSREERVDSTDSRGVCLLNTARNTGKVRQQVAATSIWADTDSFMDSAALKDKHSKSLLTEKPVAATAVDVLVDSSSRDSVLADADSVDRPSEYYTEEDISVESYLEGVERERCGSAGEEVLQVCLHMDRDIDKEQLQMYASTLGTNVTAYIISDQPSPLYSRVKIRHGVITYTALPDYNLIPNIAGDTSYSRVKHVSKQKWQRVYKSRLCIQIGHIKCYNAILKWAYQYGRVLYTAFDVCIVECTDKYHCSKAYHAINRRLKLLHAPVNAQFAECCDCTYHNRSFKRSCTVEISQLPHNMREADMKDILNGYASSYTIIEQHQSRDRKSTGFEINVERLAVGKDICQNTEGMLFYGKKLNAIVREQDSENDCILLGNISLHCVRNRSHLWFLLSSFGAVTYLDLKQADKGNINWGYAVVQFETIEYHVSALHYLKLPQFWNNHWPLTADVVTLSDAEADGRLDTLHINLGGDYDINALMSESHLTSHVTSCNQDNTDIGSAGSWLVTFDSTDVASFAWRLLTNRLADVANSKVSFATKLYPKIEELDKEYNMFAISTLPAMDVTATVCAGYNNLTFDWSQVRHITQVYIPAISPHIYECEERLVVEFCRLVSMFDIDLTSVPGGGAEVYGYGTSMGSGCSGGVELFGFSGGRPGTPGVWCNQPCVPPPELIHSLLPLTAAEVTDRCSALVTATPCDTLHQLAQLASHLGLSELAHAFGKLSAAGWSSVRQLSDLTFASGNHPHMWRSILCDAPACWDGDVDIDTDTDAIIENLTIYSLKLLVFQCAVSALKDQDFLSNMSNISDGSCQVVDERDVMSWASNNCNPVKMEDTDDFCDASVHSVHDSSRHNDDSVCSNTEQLAAPSGDHSITWDSPRMFTSNGNGSVSTSADINGSVCSVTDKVMDTTCSVTDKVMDSTCSVTDQVMDSSCYVTDTVIDDRCNGDADSVALSLWQTAAVDTSNPYSNRNIKAARFGYASDVSARDTLDEHMRRAPVFDTHCHLDFIFDRLGYTGSYESFKLLYQHCYPKVYYAGCVAIFCRPWEWQEDAAWSKFIPSDDVFPAFGCHPHYADEYSEAREELLISRLQHPRCVALGEIGLDYSGKNSVSKEVQKRVLVRQLKLARRFQKPVVIHCRDASQDCLAILKQHLPVEQHIHRHCFTDTWADATQWMGAFDNLYLGFTNLITKDRDSLSEVVARMSIDRMLLETDAPYFRPTVLSYQANHREAISVPGHISHVAAKVSAIRRQAGVTTKMVLHTCYANARRLYRLPL